MLKAFVPASVTRLLHRSPPALLASTLPSQHPFVFDRQSCNLSPNAAKPFHTSSSKAHQQPRHEEAAGDDAPGRRKTSRSTAAKTSLRRVALEAERSSRTGINQEQGREGKDDIGSKIKVRSNQDSCSVTPSHLTTGEKRASDACLLHSCQMLIDCFVVGCHGVLCH